MAEALLPQNYRIESLRSLLSDHAKGRGEPKKLLLGSRKTLQDLPSIGHAAVGRDAVSSDPPVMSIDQRRSTWSASSK